jgi:hypothetical protein
MFLQEMLKISMRFNTRLDTSVEHVHKGAEGVAGSVAAVHSALLKRFYAIDKT